MCPFQWIALAKTIPVNSCSVLILLRLYTGTIYNIYNILYDGERRRVSSVTSPCCPPVSSHTLSVCLFLIQFAVSCYFSVDPRLKLLSELLKVPWSYGQQSE